MWCLFIDIEQTEWHIHCANIAAIAIDKRGCFVGLRQGDVKQIQVTRETAKQLAAELHSFKAKV